MSNIVKFEDFKTMEEFWLYNELLSGTSIPTGVPYHPKSVFSILQEKQNNTKFRIAGSLKDENKTLRREMILLN